MMPKQAAEQVPDRPVVQLPSAPAWERWLARHASSPGVWLQIAKQGSGVETVRYPEALDVALCYGWIDGLRHKHDDRYFRQRFTPRRKAAKADGRWEAAYESQSTIGVPDDLAAALRRNRKAQRFFESLDSRNRYAILYRIGDAKRPDTRARRIEQFVTMLAERRTIH